MTDRKGPAVLPLHPDAEELLVTFARAMKARARAAVGPMASANAKARGQAVRLANNIEHLWWCGGETGDAEPEGISAPAMRAAIQLMNDYFLPMAERVFGDASIPYNERLAMILARYLRQEKLRFFNARDLHRRIGGPLRVAADMKVACDLLVEANLIRPVKRATGGRPALEFEVNPVVHQEASAPSSPCANSAKSAKTPDDLAETEAFDTIGTFGTRAAEGEP
jgi:hypothetical protein